MKQTSVEWLFEKLLRADKLETLAKLLSKSWYYGNWQWENPNERIMQMLMQDLGYYPFKSEDEMIQQTKIDDGLDKELYKEASRRIPTYGKLSEDLVENKLDLSKMESKLDESLANETPESLTEWMDSKREDDVEKLAKLVKEINKQPMTFIPDETLYTEEQVREAIKKALHIWNWRAGKVNVKSICEEVIQSLKQPKQ